MELSECQRCPGMSASLERSSTSSALPVSSLGPKGDNLGSVGGEGDSRSRRMMGSRLPTVSPLNIFGNAKKKMNSLFVGVSKYLEDVRVFTSAGASLDIFPEVSEVATSFEKKVRDIADVLSRDHMKVAFFGRTSNGKSTVINAILHKKLLPSGIGHTTNCFVQVEGAMDSPEGYVLTEDSAEKKNISSVMDLAGALSTFKLSSNELVRLCWPRTMCPLLKHDIVFVDSPGIDVSQDTDSWIDRFCLDADVFVMVGNAESTLNSSEKNFLIKVSQRLSKPNVFVLNNRWDASDDEPEIREKVYTQHMDRYVDFLVNELKCCTSKREASDRIFFVSAKEALATRTRSSTTPSTPGSGTVDGAQARLFEFSRFESKFQDCVSRSAVQTKFAQHAEEGLLMVDRLRDLMGDVIEQANAERDSLFDERQKCIDRLRSTEKSYNERTNEIKAKIQDVMSSVEHQVSLTMTEEIQLLSRIVDTYERPFHPDDYTVRVYKQELHSYLEQELGRSLETKCSSVLAEGVLRAQNAIKESISTLLPDGLQEHSTPPEPFTIACPLGCANLCADFKEDIRFRFSLGFRQILERWVLGGKGRMSGYSQHGDGEGAGGGVPPALPAPAPLVAQGNLVGSLVAASPTLMSTSSLGALLVAGIVVRVAGLRVVGVLAGVYGTVYVYEWAMWTNKAKERAFKEQYVRYASGKLKLIVDMTGRTAGHQVQQSLSLTFNKLCHQVDQEKKNLEGRIDELQRDISALEDIASRAKVLRNTATWLGTELKEFISTYLQES